MFTSKLSKAFDVTFAFEQNKIHCIYKICKGKCTFNLLRNVYTEHLILIQKTISVLLQFS